MKILFTVTGVGLGHAVRDEEIIKKLNAKVRIGTYGDAYDFFKYDKFKIPYIKFPNSGFSLSIFKVLLWNIFTPVILFRAHLKLKEEIKKFKPDLIITDSELITCYTGKKMKVIAIHNHNLKEIERVMKEGNLNLRLQARFLYRLVKWGERYCDKVIIPNLVRGKGINPIVKESKKTIKNDAILIMLGGSKFGYSFIEKLIPFLKKINERFIIFGYKDFKDENIISYKFNPDFVSYLKGCKGLITLAGYSALSEALFYKIPSLVFSIPGHLEQHINAESVSKIFLIADSKNPEESIERFLKDIPEQKKRLKKLKVKNGLDEAVRIIKTI